MGSKKTLKGLEALAALQQSLPDNPSDHAILEDGSWDDIPSNKRIPLQVLKLDDFVEGQLGYQGMTDDNRMRSLLKATASADKDWQPLYARLCDRVKSLAAVFETKDNGEVNRAIVVATFPGYVRVGGFPGFWERLLPVMHPIYGIPYVPSSSIKGALRAWARNTGQPNIDRLLGYINGNSAAIAAVEILDAFPMQPCLKVDVATPQWKWDGEDVKYGTAPHQLLSLEKLKLQIGLCQTSRGTLDDVRTVMGWLEDALLNEGIGSRVSAGYGRTSKVNDKTAPSIRTENRFISRHKFEFWSQGMYGLTPPSRENQYEGETEFRVTAVRGILRYWFRAVALGLFPPAHCQMLEHILFGTLEPKARHGHFRISVSHLKEAVGNKTSPHHVEGTIVLEAKTQDELSLLEQLLKLATHLGGVGRGSRRSLHTNKDGNRTDLRGCYWQLLDTPMQLDCDADKWATLLTELGASFRKVKEIAFQELEPEECIELERFNTLSTGFPGDSEKGNRRQDVLNANARIYLLKTSTLKHPSKQGWDAPRSRGAALEFLYSSGYKGVSRNGQSNIEVGGALETPSFVWITSNHLQDLEKAYQVITVFGANQVDRAQFCSALKGKYTPPILSEITPSTL